MSVTVDRPEWEAAEERSRRGSHLVEVALRIRELGILLVLGLVVAVTAAYNPRFLSAQSIRDLLLNASIIALLTVGQTLVVITRNVDLSVGSVLGLSAFMTGDLLAGHQGLPIVVALLAGIVLGAACGAVNGAVTAIGRVPSLVVTLGTLYVFRGIDFGWAGGRQINASNLPDSLLALGSGRILGVPYLVAITVVLVAVTAYVLRSYRSGRELYAIGSNPDAAVLAGIPVGRRVFAAFVLSGAVAGLAGMLWTARYGTVDATAGTGFELQVISAVVVGGVAIFGGSGSVVGAALGALLLSTIGSALVVLKVPSFWQQAIVGALLIGAIALDRWVGLRIAAALRQRSIRSGS
ncbi:MAG TPA: ABC transporter permease [Actinomycetota bacterium]|jgi:rhamnose transport system permease protein|nr:ABC transporter permease [Actinomycetota bacterium]